MRTSFRMIETIKDFEGFRSQPYRCPANVPTIGYGCTTYPDGTKVRMSDKPITEAQATDLLRRQLIHYENAVDRYVQPGMTQGQFDALVSFAYNVGLMNFRKSTLLEKINLNPQDPLIADEFKRWNKVHGKPVKGLTLRRIKEAARYFSAIAILFLLFSCGCPKPVVSSEKTKEITDVRHRFAFHDTVLLIEPKAVTLSFPVPCREMENGKLKMENNFPLIKENGNARVRVEYRNRKIYVQAECDTVKLIAKLKHEYTDSIRTITHEVTKVQRVKYTPKAVKLLAGLGLLALLALGIGLFFRIKNLC